MRVYAPLPENLVSLRFVCFLLCTTVTRQMFLFVPSVLASLTCFKTKVLIWAAEKRVTRGTSYNLFAPFMKSSPSNIEDSPEYALEIFQDFNFLWQDKLFSNMDITIFPNTAIPIGEGLLALKYFSLTSKRSQEKTASPKWFRVNTQFFSFGDTSWLTTFLLSADPWRSTKYEREEFDSLLELKFSLRSTFLMRRIPHLFVIYLFFTLEKRFLHFRAMSHLKDTSVRKHDSH